MNVVYKKLEDVCEILDSRRVPITAKDRKAGDYPYYGANGLQDYVADYIFDDELVLLAEDGGNFGSKERPIAYRVSGKCWVNNHAHVLKAKPNMHVDYLCYALMFYDTEGLVNGATRQKLTQAAMRQMVIPYRDMTEQLQIIKKISQIVRSIEKRKEELQLLDQLVKSRFIELFGSISEEVPLSYYIAGLNAGKSLAGEEENPNKVLKTGAATYDYFDATQIKNLPIDYEPQESHRVKAGDVIISRMNTAELVGAAAYVWDVPEHIYLPDRLWRADVKETAIPIFVWQVLIQSSTKESIRRIASGTSGSMKNISKLGLLGIRVVKAPINLQQQFAAFVEQTDKSKYYSSLSFRYCQAAENAYRQEWITCRTSDF